MNVPATATETADLKPDDIVAFLRGRPNFLIEHPELLEALTPPEERTGKKIVNFQDFMLKRLQANYDWLKTQQRELISNSRANLHNLNRIHQAVLLLMEAVSFSDLTQIILHDFVSIFDVDAVSIMIESDNPIQPELQKLGIRIVQTGMTEYWLEDNAVMLDSNIVGDPIVFGPAAPLVKSQLLLRLEVAEDVPLGMLALGSRDPLLFQEMHGTELVLFMARAVERSLRFWLEFNG